MYAILIEDKVSEQNTVLPTLAADSVAAVMLMMTTATAWCKQQVVDLDYDIQSGINVVSVLCGKEVALSLSLISIENVVGTIPDDDVAGSMSVH